MPFHLEERDDEDQPGSMDQISGEKKKVSKDMSEFKTRLRYLVQSVTKSIFISRGSTQYSPKIDD